jgi:hypothetical protein
MAMYRQGDVLLVSSEHAPTGTAVPVAREGGRLVLARGEATGHAHAIASALAELFEERDGRLVLRVRPGAAEVRLVHEEHAAIVLAPGVYEVIRQREYTPGAPGGIRYVDQYE